MADKAVKLSFIIATVDKASAKLNAIADRFEKLNKPVRNFRDALGKVRESSGIDGIIGGFKGVGDAVLGAISKIAVIGGILAGAALGVKSLIDSFDDLGDKAERLGVGVDFLASLRFAAEKSGASVDELDDGFRFLSVNIGLARANTGKLAAFLGGKNGVSPALLKQLKATKNNEDAFGLLANAMTKIVDPAKRAAFAQKVFGGTALLPLALKGAKGIGELQAEYLKLAGSQQGAAAAAGGFDDKMHNLKATTDGVKAALVKGLAPAFTIIVGRISEFVTANRADIERWAADFGRRLPDAVEALAKRVQSIVGKVAAFVDRIGGLNTVLIGLAAFIVGPMISAIVSLGAVLLTNPIGLIITGIAVAAGLVIKYWEPIKGFFVALWDGVTAAFTKAWEFISSIVDKIGDAVDTVKDAIGSVVGGSIGDTAAELVARDRGPRQADVVAQSIRTIQAARAQANETRVAVDFKNAPPGTRVTADPRGTAPVDLSVGYQFVPGVW